MELPELFILGGQMENEIAGRRISEVEVKNLKCLNMPLEEFRSKLVGRAVRSAEGRGKWLFIGIEPDSLLLFNPGMGADVIHFKSGEALPEKYHIKFSFDDGTGFTVRVWWFCYLHLMRADRLHEHKLAGKIGPSPLDVGFTLENFRKLLGNNRRNIKSFLLDQKNVAGIGNVYIQDIMFNAGLHPNRKISTLTVVETEALYNSIETNLGESIALGGLAYEKDFHGNRGGYGKEQFKVAYKSGEPCPRCGTTIQKIRTGATSSFVCPYCQPL